MISFASYSRELWKNLIEWLNDMKILTCMKQNASIVLQFSYSNFEVSLCLLQEVPGKQSNTVTVKVVEWENGKHLLVARKLQSCVACRCNRERLLLLGLTLLKQRGKTPNIYQCFLVLGNFRYFFYAKNPAVDDAGVGGTIFQSNSILVALPLQTFIAMLQNCSICFH